MKLALIANPAARAGSHAAAATRAAERLRAGGVQTAIVSGGSAAESASLLRTAIDAGVDAVAVVGGDGTVNLALQQLAGTGIPLGIIPVGTGNDFAATLGLRELDVIAAADAIASGATRQVDLGRVTRPDGSVAFFGSVLASGFDSKVNDRANAMRWPRGGSRYNIAILREFVTLRGIPYDLEFEDPDGTTERYRGDMVMATVGNGRTYGGGIPICPDADPADGLLDVVTVRPAGRLRLLRLLPMVYRGTHASVPEVAMRRARSVRLSAPGVTAYADGDPIGVLPLVVDVAPGALTVFAPAE
ncbi:diacylglycerol kinase [Microbacterium sp. HD4P20]|uniref:diacylglycerol kinase n=1 Tax=Microbacterium sp. HD4P20 TaxID=2864874 RepID=UPI001C63F74B|nr:diacylglycerol kinase [Microbacterium sp. HD4P20]MCP2637459.1 diacylglycerol kinase [Microbacterium sp. HD4P20]